MKLTRHPEPAPLTPAQKTLGQNGVIAASVISMVFWAGLNDRVISLFILRLNPAATDATLAFFFAIAPMTAILMAAVSPLVELRGKKRLLIPFYLASALALLLLPCVPFLAAARGPSAAVTAAGVILIVHGLLRSTGMAGWFPLIDDNVPAESRGRFFGRLRTSWQLMLVACSLGVGAVLGSLPTLGRFQLVFVTAIAASLLMTVAVMAIPEQPIMRREDRVSLWRMLGVPFRDRPFVMFVTFGVLYNLALALPGPGAVRCMKHTLGAGDNFVVWMDSLAALGAAATLPLWGRFVDRFGGRPIFALLLPPLALVNLLWLPLSPSLAHWPWMVASYAVLHGIFVFGISVGITDIMLGGARDGHRSAYINIAFVANTIAAGAAPFLGAMIARGLGGIEGQWHGLFLDGNRWVFLARALLFLAPLALVARLSREHGGHVGESLQQLSDGILNRLPFLRFR